MNRYIPLPAHALALAVALAVASLSTVHAQPAPAAAPAAVAPPRTLDTVVITGNPLGSQQIASPVSVLSGDALVLRRGSSLGETLDGLPGVSSSYFGPNANRPVIRGLDGDRVRVLSNAGASIDASALSYDHAVPMDPLIVDRIEVLRGPGALFYGGSAVGGVVNAIDNRIPRAPLNGLSGVAEVRLGGADRERGGVAVLETGSSAFALHADVFGRATSDLRVPRYTPREGGEALDRSRRVRNSASESRGGAIGGSLFFGSGLESGRVGLSVDTYENDYGVTAEPDVLIKMKRDHVGFASEVKAAQGVWRAIRLNANASDYEHREIEGGGAVGTVFRSQGYDVRLELEHAPIGAVRGVIGVQHEDSDFSALGEEAFVPDTQTRKTGLFALEELPWTGGTLSAGVRLEHAQVDSDGDAASAEPKFGAGAKRSFSLRSLSLSNVLPLTRDWALSTALSSTERSPTYFELYANGVHAATAAYEQGNASLAKERGTNIDVALQWKNDTDRLRAGVFSTRFSRFISLDATGEQVDDAGALVPDGAPGSVPLYRFSAVKARLNGVELEASKRLMERGGTLDGTLKFDLTRGTNRSTGEPLPRVAPWRLNLGLDANHGPWAARFEVAHSARQNRVPDTDQPTDSHTLVNVSLSRRFSLGPTDALWFVKLTNLGNELAYSASSVQTIRDLSPLPGRAVRVGLRVSF
jgi:iron complex outermembrane receptor protein